ncbi:MAG: aldo/keto reductase [Oscillospiraceae bacterium]|nr:aldo/keto reductase [Oscillospiraceae bacterium]
MQYRTFGKTGLQVSALGFGAMRFTDGLDGKVDQKLVDQLVGTAVERGVNYFDTSQNYLNGQSEPVLGSALKGLRDKVYIATKVGSWHDQGGGLADLDKHLEGQLRDLQTDYIDCYLLHTLNDNHWPKFQKLDVCSWLQRKQREGKIRFLGYSFHGAESYFSAILNDFDWDFTMIQYNYVDVKFQAGEAGLLASHAKGCGTAIMEPMRGGTLTDKLPPAMMALLKEANPVLSPAAWAFRFLYDREEVNIAISGMNCMAHLEENLALADVSAIGCLSDSERATLHKAGQMFHQLLRAPCTNCGYCTPVCPQGIDIPTYLLRYNEHALFDVKWHKNAYLESVKKSKPCIYCGKCNAECPQGIDIPKMLGEVEKHFKG